jgi:hypothetical protein
MHYERTARFRRVNVDEANKCSLPGRKEPH